ncbi:MAG: mechanosensitive ion channel family protein [Candidatus Nanohaloarchaea archaeon]
MISQIRSQAVSAITGLGIQIQASTVFAILGLAVLGYLANKLSNVLIQRAVDRRGGDEHAAVTSKKLSAYLTYTVTFVAVLGVLGVPFTALGTVIGLIGLGVSFALKDMIANFISGVLILINKPFKVGDQIAVGGDQGTVKDIRVRATDVKTYDGRKVIVPNSKLYNDTVVNNTAYDLRRFEVMVGVGYDDDVEGSVEIAKGVLDDVEGVEADPEPEVLVDSLGDSSVNLKLRGWTKPSKANMVKVTSQVTQKVKERFDEEGIDIPYPIRTVHMED